MIINLETEKEKETFLLKHLKNSEEILEKTNGVYNISDEEFDKMYINFMGKFFRIFSDYIEKNNQENIISSNNYSYATRMTEIDTIGNFETFDKTFSFINKLTEIYANFRKRYVERECNVLIEKTLDDTKYDKNNIYEKIKEYDKTYADFRHTCINASSNDDYRTIIQIDRLLIEKKSKEHLKDIKEALHGIAYIKSVNKHLPVLALMHFLDFRFKQITKFVNILDKSTVDKIIAFTKSIKSF